MFSTVKHLNFKTQATLQQYSIRLKIVNEYQSKYSSSFIQGMTEPPM